MSGQAPNQWATLNRTLQIYKLAALGLLGLCFFQVLLCFSLSSDNPVVVVKECGGKSFFDSKREEIKIGDDDISRFVETWVSLRYTWDSNDPERMFRSIEPISTDGFKEKLKGSLGKKKSDKKSKEEELQESVANVEVTITEKDAIAAFDRIVKIKGIPLVIPSQVSLQIVRGKVSRWNPLGLYVNGALEHEDK